ncbi:podocan [Eucyclogobius newberryi]|uniref:podocan n=1 Tax=Eucyclogobius newberryi TaxID=166745 RepID=UPI003B5C6E83
MVVQQHFWTHTLSALLLTWAVLCLDPRSLDEETPPMTRAENITQVKCPLDCECVSESTVSCAGAGLSEFPQGVSEHTLQLYLEDNMIKDISVEHVSHLQLLQTLNLQNNGLCNNGLEDEGLEMLEQLEFLYLANNNLTSAPKALPHSLVSADFTSNELTRIYPYTFGYKPKLRSVYLHNNKLVDTGLPDHMFNGSNNLEVLAMSSNFLTKVPRNLPSSLHQLHLKSNKLREIPAGAFENLSNLRELHLQENVLSSPGLELMAFSPLSSLEYLDLSSNNLSVVPSGLPKSLLMLHLEKNSIHTIPADSLSSLRSLEYLLIHNNKLRSRTIHPAAFQGLKKLHTLHMYNNLLERVPRGVPRRAKTLMLLHNSISEIGRNDLALLHTLTELNLSYNRLSSGKLHHEAFRKMRNLSTLDLSGNSLHLFPLGLPQSLQVLEINNNHLTSIPHGALSGMDKLSRLVLSNNQLKVNSAYQGAWMELSTLSTLDLSGNLLSHVPPDLPESLQYLHLQNNRISSIPATAFDHTPNLRGLYLRLNRLTLGSVDESAFFHLPDLDVELDFELSFRTAPTETSELDYEEDETQV